MKTFLKDKKIMYGFVSSVQVSDFKSHHRYQLTALSPAASAPHSACGLLTAAPFGHIHYSPSFRAGHDSIHAPSWRQPLHGHCPWSRGLEAHRRSDTAALSSPAHCVFRPLYWRLSRLSRTNLCPLTQVWSLPLRTVRRHSQSISQEPSPFPPGLLDRYSRANVRVCAEELEEQA